MNAVVRHRQWVLGWAITIGAISLVPYLLHPFSPKWNGLIVIRDKDYGNYYSRLERALSGHLAETSNAMTPVGSGIEGVQSSGMEQVVGLLLGWTGLPAPMVAVILMPLLAAGLFLLFYKLFLRMEFPPNSALAMTLVLFAVLFHVFTRHVQPGWSFLIAISALLATWHCWRTPSVLKAILAGILLGALPYIYFWHWTFAWASVAVFTALALLQPRAKRPPLHIIGLTAAITLLV